MKRMNAILALLMVLVMAFSLAGCGSKAKSEEPSVVGTWEYSDDEIDMGAVYVLKDDGTGTYTMIVGEENVTYELKYEVKDGHLLVVYVNNDIFTEEDVFDSEIRFQDASTMIIKDSFDKELTFVRK